MSSDICQPCRDVFEERLAPSSRKRIYKGSWKHLNSCSCPICGQLLYFLRRGKATTSIVKWCLDLFRTVDADAFEIHLSPNPKDVRQKLTYQLQLTSPSIKTEEWHYVDLVADYGTEAATFIPDRPIMSDTMSAASFDVIKGWLTTCDSSHENCKTKQGEPRVGPKRLLKLGENMFGSFINLVSVPPLSSDFKYAALSYCWGNSAEDKQVMTMMDNLQQHEQRIVVYSLPKAIQHAVVLARKLDIPYLWVDALCIVQNARSEKDDEIAKMGDIYSNAYLTIASSNSAGCGQGFLRRGDRSLYSDVSYSHEGRSATVVKISRLGGSYPTGWTIDKEPLHKRGWTFQEMMLSHRIIFFSDIQPYWRCLTTALYSGGPTPQDYFWHTELTELLRNSGNDTFVIKDSWPWLVQNYSKRILGDLDDKPKAIYAISKTYEHPESGRYFAGLWTETLHIDLAWSVVSYGKCQRDPTEMLKKYGTAYSNNQLFNYPTYSWLYYDGAVHYPASRAREVKNFIGEFVSKNEDVSREIELVRYPEPVDIFGNVDKNDPLVVKGKVKFVVVPAWKKRPESSSEGRMEQLSISSCQPDEEDRIPPLLQIESKDPGSPRDPLSCYHTSIWDEKKKRFNSNMEPYYQHEVGKISFDYHDENFLASRIDEDFGIEPLFFECMLLCTGGPSTSRTYYRPGREGMPLAYQGPRGRTAYALVLFPASLTEKSQRKRLGLMAGNTASALYFNSGKTVQYELL